VLEKNRFPLIDLPASQGNAGVHSEIYVSLPNSRTFVPPFVNELCGSCNISLGRKLAYLCYLLPELPVALTPLPFSSSPGRRASLQCGKRQSDELFFTASTCYPMQPNKDLSEIGGHPSPILRADGSSTSSDRPIQTAQCQKMRAKGDANSTKPKIWSQAWSKLRVVAQGACGW
jgi:hypothetical protein